MKIQKNFCVDNEDYLLTQQVEVDIAAKWKWVH